MLYVVTTLTPLFNSYFLIKSEQRDRYEKENAATLVEEADRIKMESEQEKADLQVQSWYVSKYVSPLLLFTFCFILFKTKNNVKNTLFVSISVRIR